MLAKRRILRCLFLSLVIFTLMHPTWSCTGIQLRAKDGVLINGRTIEFGLDLELGGIFIPRNYKFHGTLPDGSPGLTYTAKYAALGGGMFGEVAIADGINEKGLAVGDFYFPGYAQYTVINDQNKKQALSPTEFSNWILTQFATVEEVKAGIKSVVIAPTTPKGWPILPPFHYIVYDKTGKSIVIEPCNGQLTIYDNPLGVMTNSPTFDWHMTNLSNYINLSSVNVAPVQIPLTPINGTNESLNLQAFGSGSGLHGLPGDFTPPSRFVRAVIFATLTEPAETAEQMVFDMFHLLNQFDIPKGAVRDAKVDKMIAEYTLATVVRDLEHLKFYFRTYKNQAIKVLDMQAFDFNAKTIKRFSMQGAQEVEDISKST